jgi:hypothetical protein
VEESGDMLKKGEAGGSENNVVDVQQEVSHILSSAKNKQGDITHRSNKPQAMSIVRETLVPGSRSLLEAVQGLVKPTNMSRMHGVDKARRLLTIDLLVKIPMKKCILDVQLMNRPGSRDGNAKDDANRGRLDDWTESLIKINTMLLREPTNNPSCLVASEITSRRKFVLEDPLS